MKGWLILVGALPLAVGCVEMQPTVVEAAEFLGTRENPPGIYTPRAGASLLPVLDVRFDPMERLMLVNFEDDPVYEGIELQTFVAPGGGESALALLWRRGGVVDVYMSPNHRMDDVQRRGIENLLNEITVQRAEFDYRLNVTAHGLDARLRIRDREGRDVGFEIVETRGEPRVGALIAPVGARVERPQYLPLVFLDEFALVRRRGARVEITIDGQPRTPAKMTRWVKGPASYFTRYSTRVVIANWNERRDVLLDPVPLRAGDTEVTAENLTYGLRWNGAHAEVEWVVARHGDDRVRFRFSPALPDMEALREGASVEGRFVIDINEVPGITAGEFSLARDRHDVRLEFRPLQAWQPPILDGPPWIASYRYGARIHLAPPQPRLTSEWRRVE